MLIDSHIHLYADQFKSDIDDLIKEAIEKDIQAFVLPNIDSSSIDDMLHLSRTYPSSCFACMGLHPCSVKENYKDELDSVRSYLFDNKNKFYAVGELGIDMYWDKSTLEIQKKALVQQMEWASELDLPIIIHSREATSIVIDVIKEHKSLKNVGVFHCFSDSEKEANQIIDLGFKLGIGGVLTFKNGGLDKALANIDLEQIILETDGPYLAPVPYRGKRNEPAYVELIAKKLAELKQMNLQEVADITTANSIQLFKLPINEKK
ncbi:MAG: TatD family hydrolase [Bacteroidia bacterium]|nr:TatD family hydrolase [Bacteroidia bacterium]